MAVTTKFYQPYNETRIMTQTSTISDLNKLINIVRESDVLWITLSGLLAIIVLCVCCLCCFYRAEKFRRQVKKLKKIRESSLSNFQKPQIKIVIPSATPSGKGTTDISPSTDNGLFHLFRCSAIR